MVNLNISRKDMNKSLGALAGMEKELRQAVRASLRRVGQSMRAQTVSQVKGTSFLLGSVIRKSMGNPIYAWANDGGEVTVRVSGKPLGMDRFKLVPRRPTARKGIRSINWASPSYQTGPNESVRTAHKAFVIRKGGRLLMLRRSGQQLRRVYGYAPQYFAAFEGVSDRVLEKGRETFMTRLKHEMLYRLGRMGHGR